LYLLRGDVAALFRCELVNLLSASVDVEQRIFAIEVGISVLRVVLADQRVGTDLHRLAEVHLLLAGAVEGETGEPNKDDSPAEVDDVAAVTPGVALNQQKDRREKVPAGLN